MSPTATNPAATWITPSRKVVAQTRALLVETHSLIPLNRRRLNPWRGVSGSSDDDGEDALLQDVLDHLYRGVLVPAPVKVWAGKGTGQICAPSAR